MSLLQMANKTRSQITCIYVMQLNVKQPWISFGFIFLLFSNENTKPGVTFIVHEAKENPWPDYCGKKVTSCWQTCVLSF